MLTESKTNQEEDQALKLVLYSAGIALLSGASLMGIIAGALLSVPLVTASLFLAEEFYVKRQDNNSNQVAGSTCAEHQAKEPALSQHQLEQSTAEESS